MKKIFDNKRDLIIEICVIFGVAAVIVISLLFMKNTPSYEDKSTTQANDDKKAQHINYTETIAVIPTMDDVLLTDSTWTPTFQLIWNDLKKVAFYAGIKERRC